MTQLTKGNPPMFLGLQSSWTKLPETPECEGQWRERRLQGPPAWEPGRPPVDIGDSRAVHEEPVTFHTNLDGQAPALGVQN